MSRPPACLTDQVCVRLPGYDQMGGGGGMKTLCDATAYGSDRVCEIPKMIRHRYDSLHCSCAFPSWTGK